MAKPQSNESGFTIIELLIVLGIAGLIFSLIFLAVPSLQRSSRNNQRKQDVAAVLQGISRYSLNNGGKFPTADAPSSIDSNNLDTFFLSGVRLTYYVYNQSMIVGQDAANPPNRVAVTSVDALEVYNYEKCDPVSHGAKSGAAGYRDIVALYAIETATGSSGRCQQL